MTRVDPKQTSLDFSLRGHRLRLLNRLELPKMPGTSPAALLSVLRRLDDHARDEVHCRVWVKTIAEGAGLSQRSVYRALSALEKLGVVSRHYTGRSSFFRIEWSELAELEKSPAVADQACHHGRPELTPWQTRTDTVADLVCHHGRPTEASFESQSPPPPETGAEAETWEAAAEEVAGAGVNQWRSAVADARSAGVGPEYVLTCVAIFRQVGAWEPGALCERLRNAAPFVLPQQASTWPRLAPPDTHQAGACDLLRRVRDWCGEQGHADVASCFQLAARSEKYGPYTETQIARALFEAGLFVPAGAGELTTSFQGAKSE